MTRQPFHLLDSSPWPLTAGIGSLVTTSGIVIWFHSLGGTCAIVGTFILITTIIQWWRDVVRERTFMGYHTRLVTRGLRWGIILFITSEILFFFAFFWAFFISRLAPTTEVGCVWPPVGVNPINPFAIPLLNTAILLASGVTVTWRHHALIEGHRKTATQALFITVTLGIYFSFLQYSEYLDAPFTIADRIYGTVFFVATGFHGAHVLIGSIFLFVCIIRIINHQFSPTHHFGFEAAAWYWHFVDVVWIFLYLRIYWWGS